MSPSHPLHAARFVRAVHLSTQLPPDRGFEVAIAGRSNAGKSSALNALCGQPKLARTSKTPGRTQQLVFFEVGPDRHLVDLPGYGYAEVPAALRQHWGELIDHYLSQRAALCGLLLVMDIRHPLREYDRRMLDYARARGFAVRILLTKADKLARARQLEALREVQAALAGSAVEVQLFSALHGIGIDPARDFLVRQLRLAGSKTADTSPRLP